MILVRQLTSSSDVNRAGEMTTHGRSLNIPLRKWIASGHSPIRALLFWVELHGIPSFVSVHIVRHKIGVEHFVQSMRDDRGGASPDEVTRNTPVNHGMLINAEALITMSHKRLCYKAHTRTVALFSRLRKRLPDEVSDYMVPECVHRGYCPEFTECAPGLKKVLKAYRQTPQGLLRYTPSTEEK